MARPYINEVIPVDLDGDRFYVKRCSTLSDLVVYEVWEPDPDANHTTVSFGDAGRLGTLMSRQLPAMIERLPYVGARFVAVDQLLRARQAHCHRIILAAVPDVMARRGVERRDSGQIYTWENDGRAQAALDARKGVD